MSWLLFNSAAVNIRGNVPFQISGVFPPCFISRNGIIELYRHSIFSFWKLPHCFPWWLYQFIFLQECLTLHGSQPCHGEGACITQWSYESCHAGPPKWMSHSRKFWYNLVHQRRECKPLQCSCLKNAMNNMKRQKDVTAEDDPSMWGF